MGANRSITNPASVAAMFIAFCHMASISMVVPALWVYIHSLGHASGYVGWAFAAPIIGGYICGGLLTPSFVKRHTGNDTRKMDQLIVSSVAPNRVKVVMGCFLLLGISGHLIYAFNHHYYAILVGRFLVGCACGTMVLCQQIVEGQTAPGEDVVLRSRMVLLGMVQAMGTVFGLVLATTFYELPDLSDEHDDQHQIVGIVGAGLYGICLLLTLFALSTDDFEKEKTEVDVPYRNSCIGSRLGMLPQAVVYDHGQAKAAAIPDVFTTTVLLVLYFFVNNMIAGVEVLHGLFSVDTYDWTTRSIGITWTALILTALLTISIMVALAANVPCNRRMFGAVVLLFVTYGLMLQRRTPKGEYCAFLVLFSISFHIIELAATETYMDKIGTSDTAALTAIDKMRVMSWLTKMGAFTRVLGAVVAGYIYQYYSTDGRDHRRQYALYAPPFGICIVLMGMCVIFYKRFQLKAQEANIAGAEKEAMLQPQQISCMDDP